MIENGIAFSRGFLCKLGKLNRSAQIRRLHLKAYVVVPVPMDTIAIEAELLGKGVERCATSAQQLDAPFFGMAADLATVTDLHSRRFPTSANQPTHKISAINHGDSSAAITNGYNARNTAATRSASH
ncbi:hypothetical protein [Bradyrhizobium sp.]|uniref:hypothetical protein n=1 Tax=Bradyrhizobium sp. TaxID=376 RepID=UPI003BB19208